MVMVAEQSRVRRPGQIGLEDAQAGIGGGRARALADPCQGFGDVVGPQVRQQMVVPEFDPPRQQRVATPIGRGLVAALVVRLTPADSADQPDQTCLEER